MFPQIITCTTGLAVNIFQHTDYSSTYRYRRISQPHVVAPRITVLGSGAFPRTGPAVTVSIVGV